MREEEGEAGNEANPGVQMYFYHYPQPLGQSYKLSKESIEKLPESIWKFSVYFITWCWSAYITYDLDIMSDVASHWYSKSSTIHLPTWGQTFSRDLYKIWDACLIMLLASPNCMGRSIPGPHKDLCEGSV